MIEAIEIKRNLYKVEGVNPATGKVLKTGTVYSQGEAIRLANTWNKLYIVETMMRWLNQRMIALKKGECSAQWETARLLSDIMGAGLNHSVEQVKRSIALRESSIRFIAPGPKSGHYKYYQKTILDIVNFCKEKKGAEA